MKKILYIISTLLLVSLVLFIYDNISLRKQYNIAQANVKAYSEQLSEKAGESRALQLTVDQLEYFNDSILMNMDSIRKELGIKDKNLKSLQYISSVAVKPDTIVLKDTIFKENPRKDSMLLDTLIGDSWYEMHIAFKYPCTITTKPWFKSQKYITVSTQKETVNPPKKLWLLRLFQKKHKVVVVNIVEENPYIQDSTSRFVEIIK